MKPYPGTQALQRAVNLLQMFSDERPAWTVADLARAAGLNRTTTYRLLSVLEAAEWVVRDPQTDDYRLGSGLIALGGRAGRANKLRTVALPFLTKLAEESGETVTLEILSGREMVIVEEISAGDHYLGAAPHVGTRWPVHATSTGKALLPHLSLEESRAVYQADLPRLTSFTLTDPERLEEEVMQSKVIGYALAQEELELGYNAVGAAVFDGSGRPLAAISIGGAAARLTADRLNVLGRLVADTARQISHALGYRAAAPD